jgi:hypothetical protein
MAESATRLIGERAGWPPAPDGPSASLAVAGYDGWLFGLGEEDVVRLGGEEVPRAGDAVSALAESLEATAQALHALGIRYVAAIAPAKLAVHRELAPRRLASSVGRRHVVALTRVARELQHLDVLDLLRPLRDGLAHGALFHARDDGLNARGAFLAQRALLKHAGLAAEGLLPLPLERAKFAPDPAVARRELEGLPVATFERGRLVPCARPPGGDGDGADVPDAAELQALRMPAPAHLELPGDTVPRVYENAAAEGVPRVLLVGDPVIDALAPWIAEATARLVVVPTATAPLEQIELEMPRVVLHVLEERLLGSSR